MVTGDGWIRTEREGFRGHRRERFWITAGQLPHDAVLVVRTAALDELKARISQSSSTDTSKPSSMDKLLDTRGRTSLLIIIAALASLAKLDVSKPSQAAVSIQAEADRLEAKIGLRTIEEHLKDISDALERRS